MAEDVLQSMLQHRHYHRQNVGINDFAATEYLQKTEQLKGSLEVDVGNVAAEQDAEAKGP
jgi:hypothetical protein